MSLFLSAFVQYSSISVCVCVCARVPSCINILGMSLSVCSPLPFSISACHSICVPFFTWVSYHVCAYFSNHDPACVSHVSLHTYACAYMCLCSMLCLCVSFSVLCLYSCVCVCVHACVRSMYERAFPYAFV